jgi:hypothetical protein
VESFRNEVLYLKAHNIISQVKRLQFVIRFRIPEDPRFWYLEKKTYLIEPLTIKSFYFIKINIKLHHGFFFVPIRI